MFLMAAAVVASPSAATAQCGGNCDTCAQGGGWAGWGAGGTYDRGCYEDIPFCVACVPVFLVADRSDSDDGIFKLVKAADADGMESLVVKHGSRLLVSDERNLLVIQGSTCDPHALSAVSVLEHDKAKALVALGVRSLEEYIAQPPRRTQDSN